MLAALTFGVSAADAASMPTKLALYAGTREGGKISSTLLRARDMVRRSTTQGDIDAALPNLLAAGDTMELDVRLSSLTPAVVDAVSALGFAVRRAHYAAARLAVVGSADRLEDLAALPEVTTIHPRYAPRLRAGAAPDQADVTTGAAAARATFAVDGSGQRIGILSDSFTTSIGGQIAGSGCERRLTGSTPQASADLPPSVVVLDAGSDQGSDEGAGIAELVHDLAPGTDIMFRSAFLDEADFADGIDELRACGASVIVDDLIYIAEPMFQDGPVAAAAERATAAGVAYFSAAGNEAAFGALDTFRDADPASEQADPPSGADFHDFGGGNRFASITVPVGCAIDVVLQWNEPFSGTLGPGAASDLDLYLYDRADPAGQILTASLDSQGCSRPEGGPAGDPLEIASYVNSGRQARTLYVAVDNFCGAAGATFRLATFPGRCNFPGSYAFDTAIFRGPQIYGHPAAAGVIAVGAVDYREVDTNGALRGDPQVIDPESFTSSGGDLPFFFDSTGGALADGVEYRFKPELAAPDGTNTSFFGSDRSDDADTWPNFYGTSAAAPHAAAIAALVRQANPCLAPDGVRRVLMRTARDIAAPGLDPLAGAGAVDGLAAVSLALAETTPLPTPTALPSVGTASPTATSAVLPGDCDSDGLVVVAELIHAVQIALDDTAPTGCPSLDRNRDGHVSVDELVLAIDAALGIHATP